MNNVFREGNVAIRVNTTDALLRFVNVWIALEHGRDNFSVLRVTEHGMTWDSNVDEAVEPEPSFQLPVEAAVPLAKALLGQLPLTDLGFSQLQAALTKEQDRVDKMLDHLLESR